MDVERAVVVTVYDGFQLLDLAGVTDVLRAATLLGTSVPYRVQLASCDGAPVRSDCGTTVVPDASLRQLSRSRRIFDSLVVVGGREVAHVVANDQLLSAAARLSRRCRRVASVCTGAFALASAGLLDGYEATTHWAWCDELAARYPKVTVFPDRIYVHDRDRWTSAGVTAAIDLTLALVEADEGAELAHEIARWLVVFVRRPGGQAQFSAQLRNQPARTPVIAELQRWLPDHLAYDLSVESLANRVGMSPRHFARVFSQQVGATPASVVSALRVEAARRLLETSDLTVQAVARAVGIGHAETLHRLFSRHVGTTPDNYRQHFGHRAT